MVLKQPLQIVNGFWGDHHHWMFFGGLTIATNDFSMVFDFSTIAFNGFRWFRTIGQTMRWLDDNGMLTWWIDKLSVRWQLNVDQNGSWVSFGDMDDVDSWLLIGDFVILCCVLMRYCPSENAATAIEKHIAILWRRQLGRNNWEGIETQQRVGAGCQARSRRSGKRASGPGEASAGHAGRFSSGRRGWKD